jgi:hypothetical protein
MCTSRQWPASWSTQVKLLQQGRELITRNHNSGVSMSPAWTRPCPKSGVTAGSPDAAGSLLFLSGSKQLGSLIQEKLVL